MKRLLLALLMLGFIVPASADLLVYNYKEVDSGFWSSSGWDPNSCEQYKETYTAFFIYEPNGSNTANIWAVWTWKSNGKKMADTEKIGEGMKSIIAQISTKKIMEIISYDDGTCRMFFSGQVKLKKIGNKNYNIASSLTGLWIWDDSPDFDIGAAKLTMSLNSNLTIKAKEKGYTTAEEGANGLLGYLEQEQGYNH